MAIWLAYWRSGGEPAAGVPNNSILTQADSYGYEIIQRVAELTGGELEWTEAMLYPVLHRLEDRMLVECYWEPAPTGRKRKYYSITNAGRSELENKKQQWRIVARLLRALWKGAA
jgi:DNA-binding PadR family transcriptional regulator